MEVNTHVGHLRSIPPCLLASPATPLTQVKQLGLQSTDMVDSRIKAFMIYKINDLSFSFINLKYWFPNRISFNIAMVGLLMIYCYWFFSLKYGVVFKTSYFLCMTENSILFKTPNLSIKSKEGKKMNRKKTRNERFADLS